MTAPSPLAQAIGENLLALATVLFVLAKLRRKTAIRIASAGAIALAFFWREWPAVELVVVVVALVVWLVDEFRGTASEIEATD